MAQTQTISKNNIAVYTQENGTREVYLHKTRVMAVTVDNFVNLDTGGRLTATTCTRMNQAANQWRLGFSVSRAGGVLTVRCNDGRTIAAPGGRVTFKVDPEKFRAERSTDTELLRIVDGYAELAKACAANPDQDGEPCSARVKHSGHYYHKNCTAFDIEGMDDDQEKEFIELSRDLMEYLYRALEQEYNYQNSDESITDTIEANEYEFTADGKMI